MRGACSVDLVEFVFLHYHPSPPLAGRARPPTPPPRPTAAASAPCAEAAAPAARDRTTRGGTAPGPAPPRPRSPARREPARPPRGSRASRGRAGRRRAAPVKVSQFEPSPPRASMRQWHMPNRNQNAHSAHNKAPQRSMATNTNTTIFEAPRRAALFFLCLFSLVVIPD